MSGLSENQRIFADEFLIDRNATRAYMLAYPRVKSPSSAATCASELRRNSKVSAYIEQKLDEMSSERIATATEVLEYFTATMRGKTLEPVSRFIGEGVQVFEDKVPRVADRSKAAEQLGKHLGLFDKDNKLNVDVIRIIDDIPDGIPEALVNE